MLFLKIKNIQCLIFTEFWIYICINNVYEKSRGSLVLFLQISVCECVTKIMVGFLHYLCWHIYPTMKTNKCRFLFSSLFLQYSNIQQCKWNKSRASIIYADKYKGRLFVCLTWAPHPHVSNNKVVLFHNIIVISFTKRIDKVSIIWPN